LPFFSLPGRGPDVIPSIPRTWSCFYFSPFQSLALLLHLTDGTTGFYF
jgi:hypothetical protein